MDNARTATRNPITIPGTALAAFTLDLGPRSVRVITVEPTHPESLLPFAVLCDGEPIPTGATSDALFQRAADAVDFALSYCGWGQPKT